MEGFHLPHEQISLWEDRAFQYKVPFPLCFISLKKILQSFKSWMSKDVHFKLWNSCFFWKNYKQHITNKKINGNDLGNKLFLKNCLRHKTNLEYKPRGLMTEIIVCKTRQKVYIVFYNMKYSKCSRVPSGRVPLRKVVYFCISKLILYFPYCFQVPGTVLFTVYLTQCNFHVSLFLLLISLESKRFKLNDSVLFLLKIYHGWVIQTYKL